MIFDQFFAYLSAISLLESTEKKKKRDICMLFRKRGANIVVKTPGGGGTPIMYKIWIDARFQIISRVKPVIHKPF